MARRVGLGKPRGKSGLSLFTSDLDDAERMHNAYDLHAHDFGRGGRG